MGKLTFYSFENNITQPTIATLRRKTIYQSLNIPLNLVTTFLEFYFFVKDRKSNDKFKEYINLYLATSLLAGWP